MDHRAHEQQSSTCTQASWLPVSCASVMLCDQVRVLGTSGQDSVMSVAGVTLAFLQTERLSWAESPDSSSPGAESGSGGGTSIHPDVLKGRVSSWPGLMIPAAHIPGWWEQVAEARLTVREWGWPTSEVPAAVYSPLSPTVPPWLRPLSSCILTITTASQLISCPSPIQPCLLLDAGRAGFIQHKAAVSFLSREFFNLLPPPPVQMIITWSNLPS